MGRPPGEQGEARGGGANRSYALVFTFVLAAPLFGEPITRRKLVGLVAAALAVLALSR